MRDPRAVEAGARLAGLVLAHLGERALVGLGVAPARDEGRHPSDREGPAPVAGGDQQVAVGPHHRRGHGDGGAVGEGVRRSGVAEVLDDAEQVVPATRVEPGDVVAQGVQDLLHLERRGDRLDEDRGADDPVGHLQRALGVREDVVPQLRLVVGLQLGQVEVGPGAAGEELAGVVEEVQPEVDQRGDHRLSVDAQVLLVEVPAARPRHDHRDRVGVAQRVVLALGRGEGDGAAHRVVQVDLAADHVDPVRGVGVLQVGEPDLGPRVERVDRHLPLGRPGDLDAAVLQVGGHRRDPPVAVADRRRLRQEVQAAAGGQLLATPAPGGEQLVAATAEAAVQVGHEAERLGRQDLGRPVDLGTVHRDVGHGPNLASKRPRPR